MKPTDTTLNKDFIHGEDKPEPLEKSFKELYTEYWKLCEESNNYKVYHIDNDTDIYYIRI